MNLMSVRIGTIVSVTVATLSLGGMVAAFLMNASPYVSITDAKEGQSGVHVVGVIDKSTIRTDLASRTTTFTVSDQEGARMNVICTGSPPSNLDQADRVVAIGTFREGAFHADKITVKCPSKYEGKQ